MKQENIKSLEKLSLFCYLCGLISVFLGILVVFMDVINKNFTHITIGACVLADKKLIQPTSNSAFERTFREFSFFY